MKMRRILVFCLSAFLLAASGCGLPGKEGVSSAITSSRSSRSSSDVSRSTAPVISSAAPAASSEQSSGDGKVSSQNIAEESASSKSNINGVVLFRETPGVHGVFWLGMTESEAFSSMKANKIIPDQSGEEDRDPLGAIIEKGPAEHSLGIYYTIYTTGFLTLEFNKDKKLIYFASKYPPQDWQKEGQKISSTYATEKGVKLHDSFDVVEKLYGKPMAIDNISPLIYTYKLSDSLYVSFRGIKQNGANEIDLFEYSLNSNLYIYI